MQMLQRAQADGTCWQGQDPSPSSLAGWPCCLVQHQGDAVGLSLHQCGLPPTKRGGFRSHVTPKQRAIPGHHPQGILPRRFLAMPTAHTPCL